MTFVNSAIKGISEVTGFFQTCFFVSFVSCVIICNTTKKTGKDMYIIFPYMFMNSMLFMLFYGN